MRITRLMLLTLLAVMSVQMVQAKYPAAQGVIDAAVICVLVLYLTVSWFNLYRRYNVADKTTLHITGIIGVCAVAAVLMNAGMVVLLTLGCVIIASGAANMLYAIHLKRAEGF